MKTYVVTVIRDEDLWVARIDGLPPGTVGTADYEHFADLHADVPELIADLTDSAPTEFTIEWQYRFSGRDLTQFVRHLREVTGHLREVQHEQEHARAELLAAMANAGMSQRTMADVVGVSHQRVNQLLKTS